MMQGKSSYRYLAFFYKQLLPFHRLLLLGELNFFFYRRKDLIGFRLMRVSEDAADH